jgi:molecular chaperone HtpG
MKEGQEAIYYITGTDLEVIKESPQLEGFRTRGVQVLLLADPVDEFWLDSVGAYKEKPFKSVTRGGADLDKIAAPEKEKKKKDKDDNTDSASMDKLVAALKLALGESVKDVCVSSRLTDSPVCLVAGEGDMDMNMERLLKRHKQLTAAMPRVLEINADHSLIRRLADLAANENGGGDSHADTLADVAHLLLDQARIVEGEPIPDPAAFSRRMASVMESGITV